MERFAITALDGVGNDREWWYWNPNKCMGHLRVGVTLDELAALADYPALADAGESGPERKRTYLRKARR